MPGSPSSCSCPTSSPSCAGRRCHAARRTWLVFRVAGAAAFAGYSFGQIPNAIWWGRPWKSAFKEFADGVVYALLTAGCFGWLWPD